MAKMNLEVQSNYRREVVESHLPHCLNTVYQSARFPCSPWWKEYLSCVVRIITTLLVTSGLMLSSEFKKSINLVKIFNNRKRDTYG